MTKTEKFYALRWLLPKPLITTGTARQNIEQLRDAGIFVREQTLEEYIRKTVQRARQVNLILDGSSPEAFIESCIKFETVEELGVQ